MRFALLAVLLAACGDPNTGGGDDVYTGGSCEKDSQCGDGLVCARDGECIAPEYTRSLTVFWTINSGPANATTCVDALLTLDFFGQDGFDSFGYDPVPCKEGQFFLDKIPTRFGEVEIYNEAQTVFDDELVDANSQVHLNLVYSPN